MVVVVGTGATVVAVAVEVGGASGSIFLDTNVA